MIKNTPKSAYRGARKIARTGAYVGGGMKGLIDGFNRLKTKQHLQEHLIYLRRKLLTQVTITLKITEVSR